jgi:hypothetical protein
MRHQEGTGEARTCAHHGGDPIQFRIPEFTSSPTQSTGPPRLQIDVQDAYQLRFVHSTYARKEDEIAFPMALVPSPTKIRLDQNFRNNFNIQSPTRPGAVHIKTDAQVAYDIQLGRSWTPWKGKKITFPMELVPHPKSS